MPVYRPGWYPNTKVYAKSEKIVHEQRVFVKPVWQSSFLDPPTPPVKFEDADWTIAPCFLVMADGKLAAVSRSGRYILEESVDTLVM